MRKYFCPNKLGYDRAKRRNCPPNLILHRPPVSSSSLITRSLYSSSALSNFITLKHNNRSSPFYSCKGDEFPCHQYLHCLHLLPPLSHMTGSRRMYRIHLPEYPVVPRQSSFSIIFLFRRHRPCLLPYTSTITIGISVPSLVGTEHPLVVVVC